MFQKFIPRNRIWLVSLSVFIIFVVISSIKIEYDLSCRPATNATAITTYAEAFSNGTDYSSKGQAREFFSLYLWQSDKVKQCYLLAIESYTKALSIEPNHADALMNRASAYLSLNRYDEAIADYQESLKVLPQNQHALLGIAQAYEKSGQLEVAVIKYEEALQFMENSDYWTHFYPERIEEYRTKLETLQNILEEQ